MTLQSRIPFRPARLGAALVVAATAFAGLAAAQCTYPVLVSGVPQSEADQMVEAMRARGATVEYLLYPDEGHGLAKLPNRISAYTKMADFYAEHLLRPAPTP